MAEIKFACPECDQRIAVDFSAVGMTVECPACWTRMSVPPQSEGIAVVIAKAQNAETIAKATPYEILERKQRELEDALEEARRLRRETETSAIELARLRQDLAVTSQERDGLRTRTSELDRLQTEELRWRGDLERLQSELHDLACERDNLAAIKQLQENNNRKFQGEIDGLRKQLSEALENTESLKKSAARQADECNRSHSEIEHRKSEIAQLHRQLGAMKDELGRLLEERQTAAIAVRELSATNERMASIQAECERHKKAHAESESRVEQASAQCASLREELTALKKESATREAELTSATQRITEMEGRQQQLHREWSEALTKAQMLESAATELSRAKEDLAAAENRREEQARALRAAQTELNSLRESAQRLKEEKDHLEKAVDEISNRLTAAEWDKAEALKQLNDPDRELEILKLRDIADRATEDANEARQILESVRAARDSAHLQLRERDEALHRAASTIDAARVEFERGRAEVAEASHGKERLELRLVEALDDVTELQERVDNLLDSLHARERDLQESLEARAALKGERDTLAAERDQMRTTVEAMLVARAHEQEAHMAGLNAIATSPRSDEVEAELERLRNRIIELETEHRELHEGGMELSRLWDEQAQVMAGLRGELDTVRSELDHLRNEGELAREQHHVILQATSEKEEEWARALEAARREAAEARARNGSSSHTLAIHERAAQADLATLVREQDCAILSLRAEMERMRLSLNEQQVRSEIDKHSSELLEETIALRTELERQAELVRNSEEAIARVKAEQGGVIESLQAATRAAEEREAVYKKEANALRTQNRELEQSIRTLERKREEMQAMQHNAANEVNDLRDEVYRLNNIPRVPLSTDSAVAHMHAELRGAREQLKVAENDRTRLREELDSIKAGLERTKQHVSVLQGRRDQMRDEIARLKVKLGLSPDAVV